MVNQIGYKLEYLRKIHGYSRKKIEDISGFKARTIESYEKGQNTPSREYIKFISLYFGFTENFITGDKSFYEYEKEIYSFINSNLETFSLNDESNIDLEDILSNESNHFYFADIDVTLDDVIRVFKMYQEIFNYTDEKMAELLEIPLNEYQTIIKNNEDVFSFDSLLQISLKLNIQYQSFKNILDYLLRLTINNKNNKELKLKCERIKDKQFYTNPLYITPNYYASIVKARNNPELVTPNTIKDNIDPKHREILELLPFFDDTFLTKLKNKLLQLKNNQNLDDL